MKRTFTITIEENDDIIDETGQFQPGDTLEFELCFEPEPGTISLYHDYRNKRWMITGDDLSALDEIVIIGRYVEKGKPTNGKS